MSQERIRARHVIPDILAPDLDIVFCGSAVGRQSAERGLPYAGRGNKFWPTLRAVGLVPDSWGPEAYRRLPEAGLGLTDLNKTQFGADTDLTADADDIASLAKKIYDHAPRLLAFTAKRPAKVYLGRAVDYGPQPDRIGGTRIFVLPSPSGLAVRFWDVEWWRRLAALR